MNLNRHIVFLLICFIIGLTSNSLAVKGKYSGNIGTRIRYTPEIGFEAAYYLHLGNGVTKQDTPYIARILMGSMLPLYGNFRENFWVPGYYVPELYVYEIYIKNRKPLWNGTSVMTFGDALINYSPYIIYTDTGTKRGIHFNDFKFGNYKADGFLFWHRSMNNPVYGVQINRKYNACHLKGILMDFKKNDSQNETVGSLEFDLPLTIGETNGIFAFQKLGNETSRLGEISIKTPLNTNTQLKTVLRDYGPEFRPYFSKKTSEIAPGKLNPIDIHYGLKGVSFELQTKISSTRFILSKDIYKNRDYMRNLTYITALENNESLRIAGNFVGLSAIISHQIRSVVLEGFSNNNFVTGSSSWLQLRKQKGIKKFILSSEVVYWKDVGTPILDVNNQVARIVNENGKSLVLSVQVKEGFLNGFEFLAAAKKINEDNNDGTLYKTIGLDFQAPTGIQVVCRYTTPNFEEPDDFRIPSANRPPNAFDLYDRFGRKVDIDNIVEIRYVTSY